MVQIVLSAAATGFLIEFGNPDHYPVLGNFPEKGRRSVHLNCAQLDELWCAADDVTLVAEEQEDSRLANIRRSMDAVKSTAMSAWDRADKLRVS